MGHRPAAIKCGSGVVQRLGWPRVSHHLWVMLRTGRKKRELLTWWLMFSFPFSFLSASSQKINRRLHLSKVKHSKFNESGQLVAFHLTSLIWCLYVVVTVRHEAGWTLGFLEGVLGFW